MQVPVLSFKKFYGSKEEKAQVAEEIFNAFTQTGFVVLVDHGVCVDTIQNLFTASKEVHSLDANVKNAHKFNPETGTGFTALGTERVNPGFEDCKEAWDIQVGKVAGQFWTEFENLYFNVLSCISIKLELGEDYLVDFCRGSRSNLRLLKYPAMKNFKEHNTVLLEGEEYYVRAGEHTDFGTLTFLVQESPGLQLKTRQGKWLNVPFIKNSVVINVADLLMRWSNDILVSTPHRVVANVKDEVQTRWCIAFFCNPRGDATISTLPNTFDEEYPTKYEPVNAYEYVLNRIKGVQEDQQSKL
eukprot:maker-scaffold_37-snap-gene-2.3-mRNA-1 protein AED:0.02 eAED:0.02 QI:73/0.5/0.66/1/1/1/3/56/299